MAIYDFSVDKGSDFSVRITGSNDDGTYFNLTNYTTSGFVKYRYSDTTHICSLNPVIHPSYVSGIIDLNIPSSGTAALPATVLVYDLFIYNNTTGEKVLEGKLNVSPYVTY